VVVVVGVVSVVVVVVDSCVLEAIEGVVSVVVIVAVGAGAGSVTTGVSVTVVELVESSLVDATGVSVTLTVDCSLFGATLTFVFVPAIAALPLPGALLLV
jgi:hypothetical protein